ncbi:MAG: hypothetical protein GY811_01870 [Myxococcales bacterium]|nr:hypothetical protein [Myxococcales bacterium]
MPVAETNLDSLLATMGAFEQTFEETPLKSIHRTTANGGREATSHPLLNFR